MQDVVMIDNGPANEQLCFPVLAIVYSIHGSPVHVADDVDAGGYFDVDVAIEHE